MSVLVIRPGVTRLPPAPTQLVASSARVNTDTLATALSVQVCTGRQHHLTHSHRSTLTALSVQVDSITTGRQHPSPHSLSLLYLDRFE